MENCNCTREGDFVKLNVVYKEVMGNGKEGLAKSSVRLETTVKELTQSTKVLSTLVSGFSKFQIEAEAVAKQNAEHLNNKKWYVRTIIAAGGLAATFITLYFTMK